MPFGTMRCGSAVPFASGRAAALVPSRSSVTDVEKIAVERRGSSAFFTQRFSTATPSAHRHNDLAAANFFSPPSAAA